MHVCSAHWTYWTDSSPVLTSFNDDFLAALVLDWSQWTKQLELRYSLWPNNGKSSTEHVWNQHICEIFRFWGHLNPVDTIGIPIIRRRTSSKSLGKPFIASACLQVEQQQPPSDAVRYVMSLRIIVCGFNAYNTRNSTSVAIPNLRVWNHPLSSPVKGNVLGIDVVLLSVTSSAISLCKVLQTSKSLQLRWLYGHSP